MPSPLVPQLDIAAFLAGDDRKTFFLNGILRQSWLQVWGSTERDSVVQTARTPPLGVRIHEHDVIFSTLLPRRLEKDELKDSSWHIFNDPEAICGYVQVSGKGRTRKSYARFGSEDGRELLVIDRRFHGMAPARIEIAESFRLWHNLHEEQRQDGSTVYLRFDASGDSHEVVRVQPDTQVVQVERSALLHFLSARKMALAVFFASQRKSELPYEDADCGTTPWHEAFPKHAAHMRWVAVTRDIFTTKWKSFTQLTGKRLIVGSLPISSPYDRSDDDEFEHFIVGRDPNGRDTLATCDPEALDNNFGKSPGAPHYLTPVFFRKAVLGKYLSQPSKYRVRGSRLECGSLWGVMIDNEHDHYVAIFLGDLGRDLPPTERRYWRAFNVATDERLSTSFTRRNLHGEFAFTESPEVLFKHLYERFNHRWIEQRSWPLFLPLRPADAHVFDALHVPLTDEQGEFDNQVLSLCKLLVDSLNEAELGTLAPSLPKESKGLDKFEHFLRSQEGDPEDALTFLRRIQDLRSAGSAHRKGSKYTKAIRASGLEGLGRIVAFKQLIAQALKTLQFLETLAGPVESKVKG